MRHAPMKKSLVSVLATLCCLAGGTFLYAQDNPLTGYAGYRNSYFLNYADGTGFSPDNSGTNSHDVKVTAQIAGQSLTFNLDTGSRGIYVDANTLGPSFTTNAGSFAGEINLTSSGRNNLGYWTPSTVSFVVTDQNGHLTNVSETVDILAVEAVQATKDNATFGMRSSSGTAMIVDTNGNTYSTNFTGANVTLSNGQKMYYSNNPLLSSVSNFGVGFDLNGQGTGPIGNNRNQIYNPFLNFSSMTNGLMVAGYVITPTGVQLGLTEKNTGYAYTQLNPTGFTSSNSVPDWQTPTGQVVIGGVTNAPGSIVLDSGIGYSYLTLPDYTNGALSNPALSINLINSGGGVGYKINGDSNNYLNPSFDNTSASDGGTSNNVFLSPPGTNGIYSQNQSPYGSQYFNSGRNVFNAFNMLYDASNGYIGLITNDYGATNSYVYFTSGFYPGAVPEPSACVLFGLGALGVAAAIRFRLA